MIQEITPDKHVDQTISPLGVIKKAVEDQYSSLQIGIRVMVARSGIVEGAEAIKEMSDDILQKTIITALTNADKFDPSRQLRPWLLGIANFKIKEIGRVLKSEREHTKDVRGGTEEDGEGESSTVEEEVDRILYHTADRDSLEDVDSKLKELLSLVNEPDRAVLTYAYVDGLSGIELAAMLGIREGAAYVRVARARQRLLGKYLAVMGRKGFGI